MPHAVQHEEQGSISLGLSIKHKTPLADVTKNHTSVCLGVEGVWSLFLPLAKASTHKISLP